MTKPAATVVHRKGSRRDQDMLIGALALLVDRAGGEVRISSEEWSAGEQGVGLRARYESNGDLMLWTYHDIPDEIRKRANPDDAT